MTLIIVKSGTLVLTGCNFNIEAPLNKVAQCIYLYPNSTAVISHCSFKGGGLSKNITAGIYINKGNCLVQNCHFEQMKSGCIIGDLNKKNDLVVVNNAFISCYTTCIYVQGPESSPAIIKNVFMVCKDQSIIINRLV